jgi:hypothetical protein
MSSLVCPENIEILTLTRRDCAQLDLTLLVGELGRRLAEEDVEPALVRRVRHQDEDGEEEEGEDGLPDLHQVLHTKKVFR